MATGTTTCFKADDNVWLTYLSNAAVKPEQQTDEYKRLCQTGWKFSPCFASFKNQKAEYFMDFFDRYFGKRETPLPVPRDLYLPLYNYCTDDSFDLNSPIRCFPLYMTEVLAFKLGCKNYESHKTAESRGYRESYPVANFRHDIKIQDEHLLLVKVDTTKIGGADRGKHSRPIYLLFAVPWTYERNRSNKGSQTAMHGVQVFHANSYKELLPQIPDRYREQLCLMDEEYHPDDAQFYDENGNYDEEAASAAEFQRMMKLDASISHYMTTDPQFRNFVDSYPTDHDHEEEEEE